MVSILMMVMCGCESFGGATLTVELPDMTVNIGDRGTDIFDGGYTIKGLSDDYPSIPGESYESTTYEICKGGKSQEVDVAFANYSVNKQLAKNCQIYSIRVGTMLPSDVSINGVKVYDISREDAVKYLTEWGVKFDDEKIESFTKGEGMYLSGKIGNFRSSWNKSICSFFVHKGMRCYNGNHKANNCFTRKNMNKDIIKQIKTTIKVPMKNAGFKVDGRGYSRIINDTIFQSFDFQGSLGGDRFTINIGITPLFTEKITSHTSFWNYMRIGTLMMTNDIWWPYTEESVNEVADIILNTVLPHFEQCSTYEGILKYYGNIASSCRARNDKRNPELTVINITPSRYILGACVRTDNYEILPDYIQAPLDFYENELQNPSPGWDSEHTKSIIANWKKRTEEYLAQDKEVLRKQMIENEEYNCRVWSKYRVKD